MSRRMGDIAMIDYLCQRGEVLIDCGQVIFNSDSLTAPVALQWVLPACDVQSYRQALLECVSRVRKIEKEKSTALAVNG